MKEKFAGFNIALAEVVDVPTGDSNHPFLTVAKFFFADDKPNGNNQAVPYEEFDNIIRTAIGMPVKIHFSGDGAEDHQGSVPFGYIRNMEKVELPDGTHQLLAEAALWTEEYPEEVQYLRTAFAEGKAPGISYELRYKESFLDKGIEWLKNVVTQAATFVRKPAYGTRTHLIALASLKEEDRHKGILTLAEAIKIASEPVDDNPDEGGNQMEEELTKLKAEAASKQAEIDDLNAKLTEANTANTKLTEEIDGLKLAALFSDRKQKYVAAGFTLEADAEEKKKTLWSTLSDEQFDEYLAELVAVKGAGTPQPKPPTAAELAAAALATASQRNGMPRVEVTDEDASGLKEFMRGLSRPQSA